MGEPHLQAVIRVVDDLLDEKEFGK